MHILPTVIREFLCHTGTRSLVRSSAVSNYHSIVRNLVDVAVHFLRRHSDRTGQLLIGLSPRRRIARIDKRKLFPAIQPLRDFINCNSGNFHNVLLLHTEKTRISQTTQIYLTMVAASELIITIFCHILRERPVVKSSTSLTAASATGSSNFCTYKAASFPMRDNISLQ